MITLTKLDGETITVNSDEIETVETIKDTVLTLRSGRKILVKENYHIVIEKTIVYKKLCNEVK